MAIGVRSDLGVGGLLRLVGDGVAFQCLGQASRQQRIARIEIGDARQRLLVQRGDLRRRPGSDFRGTAHRQRHVGAERHAARAMLSRHRRQRAIDPAALRSMRTCAAALEHVLGIEMRALAIRRGHRVQHREFLRGVTRRAGI